VRFERLTRGHVVAAVAALALLLVMAMDWYGSTAADEARDVTKSAQTRGAQAGEAGRALKEDAQRVIARDEKNAWQEQRSFDRFILICLLACVFLPLFAAGYRAAGKRSEPPFTPSAIAAMVAAFTALLVAYRIINEPGNDVTTTVKIGAPLGLLCLAAIGLGSASAFQGEADWAAMRRAAAAPPDGDNSDEPHDTPSPEPFDQTAN
jgi:drug/metabolite transporter (DMT)-like permease